MKNQILVTVALALLVVCLPQVNAEAPSTQIASAVERGGFVYLYNEKGNQIGCVQGGSGPKGGLMGYQRSCSACPPFMRRWGDLPS